MRCYEQHAIGCECRATEVNQQSNLCGYYFFCFWFIGLDSDNSFFQGISADNSNFEIIGMVEANGWYSGGFFRDNRYFKRTENRFGKHDLLNCGGTINNSYATRPLRTFRFQIASNQQLANCGRVANCSRRLFNR